MAAVPLSVISGCNALVRCSSSEFPSPAVDNFRPSVYKCLFLPDREGVSGVKLSRFTYYSQGSVSDGFADGRAIWLNNMVWVNA